MQINIREVKGITQQEITCTNHIDIVRKHKPPSLLQFLELGIYGKKTWMLSSGLKKLLKSHKYYIVQNICELSRGQVFKDKTYILEQQI